ncbi:PREDICTED: scavenger receptor cysteine-rich type 1 protein M130-like [Amphimedon queenslandica]|uniref:SRCR domain-containing protein n=1 Tax=Amphimedon queenslandica TaxID=400682 RepID=A0AAN0J749_AMPQE|nr:PREDICTED: scavenger receptor cysteine-rich type 1 protein M130-like [Amphimedon queenslandica]|eukprot:XP_019852587.1 PREDICTED: scavenger receptor cysteine-rich type 1 protein M130-like [Amphimedon queenslandica]
MGRVEVYCNGQWGTICDDGFSSTDARTVCKQLGYSSYYRYDHLSLPGSYNKPIWSTHFSSTSSSTCFNSRNSCPSSSITSCTHSEDVTVTCSYSSSSTSVSTVGYCNSNITTTRSNHASVVGGAIGGTFGAIILIIITAVIFVFFYTRAKKRGYRRMIPVRSTAQRNVASNNRSNIQLNTIPTRSQTWQQPPQYTASPTAPLTFPPNATSHGGYYFYVPQNMAIPSSAQFYPYPVATLQQTPRDHDEGETSEADADPICEAEPPRYDTIFENAEL